MERCAAHDELISMISSVTKSNELQHEQVAELFKTVKEIKTAVDKNAVRAEMRDVKMSELRDSVQLVDRKIENGLRSDVRDCSYKVKELAECFAEQKKEQALAARQGINGFFAKGWAQFKTRAGFYVIMFLLAWGLWIVSKIKIFHEGPIEILKLFGMA